MIIIAIHTQSSFASTALERIIDLRRADIKRIADVSGVGFDYIMLESEADIIDKGYDARSRIDREDIDCRDYRRDYRRDDRHERRDTMLMGDFQQLVTRIESATDAAAVLIISDKVNVAVGDGFLIEQMFNDSMDSYTDSFRQRGVILSTSVKIKRPAGVGASSSLNLNKS